jgi:hypothetical protein
MADHVIRIEDHDVTHHLDVAGRDRARAGLLHHHALRALALHLDGDVLDVEHDVGDVLAHAGDRRELVQHAIDVHRLHGRALQRGEQNAPQRVPKCYTEPALERLGHHRGDALGVDSGRDLQFFGADQFLPVLLDHSHHHLDSFGAGLEPQTSRSAQREGNGGGQSVPPDESSRPAGACAAGSRCAGSVSHRGSR